MRGAIASFAIWYDITRRRGRSVVYERKFAPVAMSWGRRLYAVARHISSGLLITTAPAPAAAASLATWLSRLWHKLELIFLEDLVICRWTSSVHLRGRRSSRWRGALCSEDRSGVRVINNSTAAAAAAALCATHRTSSHTGGSRLFPRNQLDSEAFRHMEKKNRRKIFYTQAPTTVLSLWSRRWVIDSGRLVMTIADAL